ncbi:MAG: asparagine synthase-related protein [Terracidiphilus sp.]|jgi:asparagine synthase (glutamine-hydrolysing)
MSTIFGIRKPAGATVSERELLHLAEATKRFSPDGSSIQASGRVGMGFQPYYTHVRSRLEIRPVADDLGNLLSFDGRLDNYEDLAKELQLEAVPTPDSRVVLAAFTRWGEKCFSRLIGDWAIGLWSERDQSLYLARDHAGTRTLYFRNDKGTLRWSTHLDTFFDTSVTMELDEDYAACYLASRPIRDLTPYKEIRAVLPAHYTVFQNQKVSRKHHWEWMVRNTIRHNSDKDYEEHFFELFKQSVARRTGPDAPILAQLSGGMDSTSIVCMSDHIRRSLDPYADILDTISFYDDSEPTLNDRRYFTAVEAHRGKVGVHMDTSFSHRTFQPHDTANGTYLLPGADSSAICRERTFHQLTENRNYRVVLSGIGGDELLGGVPIPTPELADYLISGNLSRLLQTSIRWSLVDRSPLILSLLQTLKFAALVYLYPRGGGAALPAWMPARLRRRMKAIAAENIAAGSRFGLQPTTIDNGAAWWSIMESLPHLFPALISRPEYRYPLLDRDLVHFLLSIPREQLFRPGRKRSLMRRALAPIVPTAVLERRRKAYQLRTPLLAMQHASARLDSLFSDSALATAGLIKPETLQAQLKLTLRSGESQWWQALLRAADLELWVRANAATMESKRVSSRATKVLPA